MSSNLTISSSAVMLPMISSLKTEYRKANIVFKEISNENEHILYASKICLGDQHQPSATVVAEGRVEMVKQERAQGGCPGTESR